MTHNQFDDEQLEHLLNNAPKLSDQRSKEDVLKRLLADARLQNNQHLREATQQSYQEDAQPLQEQPKKQQRSRRMPIYLGAAAVFALSIITGSMFMKEANHSPDQATRSSDTANYSIPQEDSTLQEGQESAKVAEADLQAEHANVLASNRTSVYEEDLTDAVALNVGLVSRDEESIPMTYVIPNERVATDFGKEKPSTLDMYKKYTPQIEEEAQGFTEYHPYEGELKEEGDTIVHTLPEDNPYDVTIAATDAYKDSLQDTFTDSEYKTVAIEQEDGTAYEFAQEDQSSQAMLLTDTAHYSYYVYKDANGVDYLAPDHQVPFTTVMEALQAMKQQNKDVFTSAIPESVTYTVQETAEGIIVTFDAPLDLTTLDAIHATQMIEAMMLTTASFNKQLRLDNVVQESWEGFDLKNFLPKPVGPNKQYMP
ncbi:RNA polymerase subunit sigma [Lysinibacillus piscis]|uniref:RNA polymerase subunit sigma n=1 Tax=Lysinibacillus piscis TaxID=2518931 RepID=A0ABQ5NG12_9BACI|nr:RNA polymerase subunit sigma [Lysinibacillus sp. KH24]GLC87194.1 hypothetical protein LYSBPC_03210 [Lysinibacillus sp. KH24]